MAVMMPLAWMKSICCSEMLEGKSRRPRGAAQRHRAPPSAEASGRQRVGSAEPPLCLPSRRRHVTGCWGARAGAPVGQRISTQADGGGVGVVATLALSLFFFSP
jgi:hypothetical protein